MNYIFIDKNISIFNRCNEPTYITHVCEEVKDITLRTHIGSDEVGSWKALGIYSFSDDDWIQCGN